VEGPAIANSVPKFSWTGTVLTSTAQKRNFPEPREIRQQDLNKEKTQMSDTWFAVEDNNGQLFSVDEVKVSFRKDPQVGRVWTMSYAQLADLQSAIETYLGRN
jgi:hypothetical protein